MTGVRLPLASSQHDVWLDARSWPDSAHLNIGGGAFLHGSLDIECFRRALSLLVAETEALRLAPLPDGSQNLLPTCEPDLEFIDLSASPDHESAMRRWWQTWMAKPFALDGTPPWRMALLHGTPTLHGLTIQFHHLVMDGWGTSIVMQRWSQIYNDLQRGDLPAPPECNSYRDFIRESNAYRESDSFKRDQQFWSAEFPQLPEALFDFPATSRDADALLPAHLDTFRIPRSAYDDAVRLLAQLGHTPFVAFLAALAIYFARTRNRPEIVIGVPHLNRVGKRFRATPGMFAGMFPLRLTIDPAQTISTLLASIASALRAALRRAGYPLSELGKQLQLIRHGRDGIFDLLLSFERQDYQVRFGDAELIDSRQLFSGIARYPLGVTVCEFNTNQDVELALEGSSAYFAEGDMSLLGHRLWHILQAIAATPETTVDAIGILPDLERSAIIDDVHRDVAVHATTLPFITQFEHQVALRPQSTALAWDRGTMSYERLDGHANRLARQLSGIGCRRDSIVAVAISRSPEMVVAVLAIAKSGAAFLPIDVDAPDARIAAILGESGAIAMLVQEHNWERLSPLHPRTLVTQLSSRSQEADARATPTQVSPEGLAYVLFTSGSTGRPKGVMVEHAALSRRLGWLSRTWSVDWRDRSAQATQLTFDPSLIELLLPLVNGASVALPPPGRVLPETLATFAVAYGVTIMAFVPYTLARFVAAAGNKPGLRLRVACCGGEILSPELASRFVQTTGCRLYNVYGPTEASIFATAWECTASVRPDALPIGRPVDDTRIYVLDERLFPVPFGIVGDIHIGGGALARGYLQRPELTEEAFVADPFHAGSRIYRTGDRGWLGNDGNLHFVGRADRQIKLRGYRIELGEVETAILALDGVEQAALKRLEHDGKPVLHAWVGAAAKLSEERIREQLRSTLPDYMVPGAITILKSLPTSGSGKVDYDALPDPAPRAARILTPAPRTTLERELVALWENVLDRRTIGVHDNFFDIGGDSLAAIAILSGIEQLTDRKVSLHLLAENPTVAGLATALANDRDHAKMMIRLNGDSDGPPLHIAASGHGDLLRFQRLAQSIGGACDVRMLQPPESVEFKTITELASLYADRIIAQGDAPGYLAGFSIGGITALETARQLQERGAPPRGIVLIDTVYPGRLVGVATFWKQFGWIAKKLHVQDMTVNGRRIGSLFEDAGLAAQVLALRGYQPKPYGGPVLLIRSSGFSGWDRLLFSSWRRLFGNRLKEGQVRGLHGSMFENGSIDELANAIASAISET